MNDIFPSAQVENVGDMPYRSNRRQWIGYAAALGGVAFTVALYSLLIVHVNVTTVALSLLLAVLITASYRGLGPAIVASIAGVLCFNFFFLPPTGTLTIADPQNWIALSAFLVTAIIASQLSSAARSRAYDAERRREEIWRLYQLGRAIVAAPDSETAFSSIARQVVEVFGIDYCAIFVPNESGLLNQLAVANRTEPSSSVDAESITKAFQNAMPVRGETMTYVPLKVGIRTTGVMALSRFDVDEGTVEAVAGLVALALERARFLQEVSLAEAVKQSDKLKSALLASVSHNLRTPLTSIRTSIDSLLREDFKWDGSALREFHLIISEETFRLTRLVENLLEMARIEAGEIRPNKEWCSLSELFENTLERCSAATREHKAIADFDESLPAVKLDSKLIAEALTCLIENAAKYSPPNSEIKLSARFERDRLIVSVADQGPGISPDEADRIFDKFYRGLAGKKAEGTGMGLTIARGIVEAHGGKIWVESAPGKGSEFKIALNVEYKEMSELMGKIE